MLFENWKYKFKIMYLTAPIFHLTWPELSSYEIFLSQKKKKNKKQGVDGLYIYKI